MEKIVFWNDPKEQTIDPRLFSKTAEDLAIAISEDNKTARTSNKRTQIRKFYDEVLRLTALTKTRPGEWDNIRPMVHMLTAKAAYAQGRKLISPDFMNFIRDSVNQIERPEDLNIFSNFFEAFMGFYRLHGPNN